MSLSYIDINKTLVPYKFDIKLNNKTYTFNVKYNNVSDFFTVDLYKGDTVLVYGEKLVYGKPLFNPTTSQVNGKTVITPKAPDYPSVIIMPWDLAHKETRLTYDNLGATVFLYILTEDDLNE